MKNTMMGTYIHNNETYSFNFVTDLSMAKKAEFVNFVVDLVVDDITKRYNSILRNLIVDFYTIKYFTDIDTTIFEQSSSFVDDFEQFLDDTNIIDIIKANASPTLFDELNKAINMSIEYITGIHTNPLNDAIASLISTLDKKVGEIDLGNAMEMIQKFTGMTEDFTPESIVNAYINSDAHQKNLNEIAKSKKEKAKIAENLDKAIKIVKYEAKDNGDSKSKIKEESEN